MADPDGLPGIRRRRARNGSGDATAPAQPAAHEARQRLDRDVAGGGVQRAHASPHVPEDGGARVVHEAHDPGRAGRLLQRHVRLVPGLAADVPPLRGVSGGGGRVDLHAGDPGYRGRQAAEVERSGLPRAGSGGQLLEDAGGQEDDEGSAAVY